MQHKESPYPIRVTLHGFTSSLMTRHLVMSLSNKNSQQVQPSFKSDSPVACFVVLQSHVTDYCSDKKSEQLSLWSVKLSTLLLSPLFTSCKAHKPFTQELVHSILSINIDLTRVCFSLSQVTYYDKKDYSYWLPITDCEPPERSSPLDIHLVFAIKVCILN